MQPEGVQVDPDMDGRCAQWQRDHPGSSVWVETNRTAVPECTGPNGKPTVAQFCAFAVLGDGRKVATKSSEGDPLLPAPVRRMGTGADLRVAQNFTWAWVISWLLRVPGVPIFRET